MKTKKILAAIAAFTLVCGAVPSQPFADVMGNVGISANAASSASDFDFNSSTGTITSYKGNGGDVVIPSEINGVDVKSIDNNAFWKCSSITRVVIPDSVTSIGEFAFYMCTSLISIEISDSVTSIGKYAFRECTSLASISIPDSVTSIDEYAFYECSALTSVKISNSVTSINKYTFYKCSSLTSVVIPDSVTSIGEYAFSNCKLLENITLPYTLSSIGQNAFSNCNYKYVVHIYSDASVDDYQGKGGLTNDITRYHKLIDTDYCTICNAEYSGTCGTNLKWALDDKGTLVIYGSGLMEDYYSGNPTWYPYKDKIKRLFIGEKVESIGYYAFNGYSELKEIIFDSNSILKSIGSNSFCLSGVSSINYIPETLKEIGFYAFEETPWLKSKQSENSLVIINDITVCGYKCTGNLEIPDGIRNIVPFAFENSKLVSVTIPDSVTSIGSSAFRSCPSLTNITAPCILKESEATWKNGCTVEAIYTHNNGTVMSDEGEEPTCTKAGHTAGKHCSVCEEVLAAQEEIPATGHNYVDGICTDCEKHEIITGKCGDSATYEFDKVTGTLTISGTGDIWESAFDAEWADDKEKEFASEIKKVEIKSGITSIGLFAFQYCTSLATVEMNSVTSIGNSAFEGCTSLSTIKMNSVTSIGHFVFNGCTSLSTIKMNSVTSIGDGVFRDCSSLASVEMNSVTSIGEDAFFGCTSLSSITVPCRLKGNESIVYAENNGVTLTWSHTEVTDERVEPTCTETGLTEGKHCSVCEEVLVAEEVIPAKGHNYVNGFCTICDGYQPATTVKDVYDIDGDGETSDDVYEISNAGQLYWFAGLVNGTLGGVKRIRYANAVLKNDITVNSGVLNENGELNEGDFRVWTPIGKNRTEGYTGAFDGKGCKISGLYFNDSSADNVGLFGFVSVGESKNKIMNLTVADSFFCGNRNVGGVCGYSYYVPIQNCSNTGKVTGDEYVGGVCGYISKRVIENCYNTGKVSGNSYIGGICGYNCEKNTIQNCYNTGAVSGDTIVGGICGKVNYTSLTSNAYKMVTNCYNTGKVTGNTYVGSINGSGESKLIENCYYLGTEGVQGRGTGDDKAGSTEVKSGEQFASGEVCWLLNGGETQAETPVFFQNIDKEAFPVLDSKHHTVVEKDGAYSNEHNFESEICTICGAFEDGMGARLAGHSLTLDGSIGVNFYMVLDESVAEDENAYMRFTLPNRKTENVNVSQAEKKNVNGMECYVFKCNVAAKEMTATIKAQMFSNGKQGTVYDYTVKEYADYLFANAYEDDGTTVKNNEYAKAYALVEAMVNYGAYSQIYFNHNTDALVNADITNTDVSGVTAETVNKPYNSSVNNLPEGVSLSGANLALESETVLNLFFSNTTGKELSFTTNNNVTLTQTKSGDYTKVTITNIAAQHLDEDVIVNVSVADDNGNYSVKYSPMNYCYNVLSKETTETRTDALKNVMRAFYLYNQQAKSYFNK